MSIKTLIAAVVGLLAVIGGGYAILHMVDIGGRGGTSNVDAFQTDSSLTVGTSASIGTTLQVGTTLTLGGSSGIVDYPTVGNCVTSSSTIFAVQNPHAATSTLWFSKIGGTQGATTTDIVVATSTTAYPPLTTSTATSSLAANIFGLAGVAANSKFYSVAGITVGPGTGYTKPNGIGFSYQGVVVGPTEWVIGFSTSTALGPTQGGTGAAQVAVPASCTYEFLWRK